MDPADDALPNVIKRESQFSSRVFAISTANELEILNKVRDYIRLNENYMEYMLQSESLGINSKPENSNPEDQLKNETEVAAVEEPK